MPAQMAEVHMVLTSLARTAGVRVVFPRLTRTTRVDVVFARIARTTRVRVVLPRPTVMLARLARPAVVLTPVTRPAEGDSRPPEEPGLPEPGPGPAEHRMLADPQASPAEQARPAASAQPEPGILATEAARTPALLVRLDSPRPPVPFPRPARMSPPPVARRVRPAERHSPTPVTRVNRSGAAETERHSVPAEAFRAAEASEQVVSACGPRHVFLLRRTIADMPTIYRRLFDGKAA
ncbi:hypothetical protein [Amycolatopsis nivea]|uniref:hypothetical protein n=1 Tax=Amycolatopsis nivea TaxID=1644109 RepID=UPI00106F5FDA|nr:hypothetical protein [Amycolatopsis nivea]